MLAYVIQAALGLGADRCCVVVSPGFDRTAFQHFPVTWVTQETPQGTGDAVRAALKVLPIEGAVLVLCGDTPLIQHQTLRKLVDAYHNQPHPSFLIGGIRPTYDHQYGCIVSQEGLVERIVEFKDQACLGGKDYLYNTGLLLGPMATLSQLVRFLMPNNEAKEYYLTDCVALARNEGIPTFVAECDAQEFKGINTREELAAAASSLQNRWRSQWMSKGVTLVDPATVFLSYDTMLAEDVVVEPYVTFGRGVRAKRGAHILSFCHIENTDIGEDVVIGPFAHLRGGNRLESCAVVGNFVEMKKTTLSKGAKAKHLSYLGDTFVGPHSNIGAGTITCNYNGFHKFPTTIGSNVFVGTHTTFIAPVTVADGAIIAAGSVITENVPKDALAIARQPQTNKIEGAQSFRKKQKKGNT